jgi:PTS system fructose-specific IIC component/fructose-specific PTS system IIC-like component
MSSRNTGKEIVKHFQSGVSYIIPLVTAAGLLTSIAVVFGGSDVWDQTETFWGVLRLIGHSGLQFIVPMISAYIAYSIADRPGLAPAFITGIIANTMGTGFLGGMITGLAVGYLVQALKKVSFPATLQSLKAIIIIPFVATAVVGLAMWYIIGPPIAGLTELLTAWLEGMSGTNAVLLSALLGGMMAVDMGGPINKIAFAFGVASFTSGSYVASTAMLMGIGLPNFGMWLATVLNKKLYSKEEIENGKTALIMGIVGITEGTIPFAVADPARVIPSIVVGTAVGAGVNGLFGATHSTMLATFMAIPFTDNIIGYLIAILAGGFTTALMVNTLKSMKNKQTAKSEV